MSGFDIFIAACVLGILMLFGLAILALNIEKNHQELSVRLGSLEAKADHEFASAAGRINQTFVGLSKSVETVKARVADVHAAVQEVGKATQGVVDAAKGETQAPKQ